MSDAEFGQLAWACTTVIMYCHLVYCHLTSHILPTVVRFSNSIMPRAQASPQIVNRNEYTHVALRMLVIAIEQWP